MPRVTYVGPFTRGTVRLATRSLSFSRSVPVEVTSDEAASLGDEWVAVKKKSTPTPTATTATTKEP